MIDRSTVTSDWNIVIHFRTRLYGGVAYFATYASRQYRSIEMF